MAPKYAFEAVIASVFFIVMFLVILIQVFGRTPLYVGPIWTEELARWLWVWMALIGIGTVEHSNAHLRMGFLTELLPRGVQKVIDVGTDVVYLGLALHLVWIAFKSIRRTWNYESVSLPTTDAVLYTSAFVAMIMIVHRVVRRLAGWNGKPTAHEEDAI